MALFNVNCNVNCTLTVTLTVCCYGKRSPCDREGGRATGPVMPRRWCVHVYPNSCHQHLSWSWTRCTLASSSKQGLHQSTCPNDAAPDSRTPVWALRRRCDAGGVATANGGSAGPWRGHDPAKTGRVPSALVFAPVGPRQHASPRAHVLRCAPNRRCGGDDHHHDLH